MRIDSLLHFGKHLRKTQIIQQVGPHSVATDMIIAPAAEESQDVSVTRYY